jgi:uncharacterized protein with von Willebrand factor type A (vWA) domain
VRIRYSRWDGTRAPLGPDLASRLAHDGVTLNVFMLEEASGLVRFMERLARLTSGRIFLMSAESAGDFVLRDYVRRRAS